MGETGKLQPQDTTAVLWLPVTPACVQPVPGADSCPLSQWGCFLTVLSSSPAETLAEACLQRVGHDCMSTHKRGRDAQAQHTRAPNLGGENSAVSFCLPADSAALELSAASRQVHPPHPPASGLLCFLIVSPGKAGRRGLGGRALGGCSLYTLLKVLPPALAPSSPTL